jgi:hypothetical protein
VVFTIDLFLIYWISRPLNLLRGSLFFTIIGIMAAVFLIPFGREFFEFIFLPGHVLITVISIIAAGLVVFEIMKYVMGRISPHFLKK